MPDLDFDALKDPKKWDYAWHLYDENFDHDFWWMKESDDSYSANRNFDENHKDLKYKNASGENAINPYPSAWEIYRRHPVVGMLISGLEEGYSYTDSDGIGSRYPYLGILYDHFRKPYSKLSNLHRRQWHEHITAYALTGVDQLVGMIPSLLIDIAPIRGIMPLLPLILELKGKEPEEKPNLADYSLFLRQSISEEMLEDNYERMVVYISKDCKNQKCIQNALIKAISLADPELFANKSARNNARLHWEAYFGHIYACERLFTRAESDVRIPDILSKEYKNIFSKFIVKFE